MMLSGVPPTFDLSNVSTLEQFVYYYQLQECKRLLYWRDLEGQWQEEFEELQARLLQLQQENSLFDQTGITGTPGVVENKQQIDQLCKQLTLSCAGAVNPIRDSNFHPQMLQQLNDNLNQLTEMKKKAWSPPSHLVAANAAIAQQFRAVSQFSQICAETRMGGGTNAIDDDIAAFAAEQEGGAASAEEDPNWSMKTGGTARSGALATSKTKRPSNFPSSYMSKIVSKSSIPTIEEGYHIAEKYLEKLDKLLTNTLIWSFLRPPEDVVVMQRAGVGIGSSSIMGGGGSSSSSAGRSLFAGSSSAAASAGGMRIVSSSAFVDHHSPGGTTRCSSKGNQLTSTCLEDWRPLRDALQKQQHVDLSTEHWQVVEQVGRRLAVKNFVGGPNAVLDSSNASTSRRSMKSRTKQERSAQKKQAVAVSLDKEADHAAVVERASGSAAALATTTAAVVIAPSSSSSSKNSLSPPPGAAPASTTGANSRRGGVASSAFTATASSSPGGTSSNRPSPEHRGSALSPGRGGGTTGLHSGAAPDRSNKSSKNDYTFHTMTMHKNSSSSRTSPSPRRSSSSSSAASSSTTAGGESSSSSSSGNASGSGSSSENQNILIGSSTSAGAGGRPGAAGSTSATSSATSPRSAIHSQVQREEERRRQQEEQRIAKRLKWGLPVDEEEEEEDGLFLNDRTSRSTAQQAFSKSEDLISAAPSSRSSSSSSSSGSSREGFRSSCAVSGTSSTSTRGPGGYATTFDGSRDGTRSSSPQTKRDGHDRHLQNGLQFGKMKATVVSVAPAANPAAYFSPYSAHAMQHLPGGGGAPSAHANFPAAKQGPPDRDDVEQIQDSYKLANSVTCLDGTQNLWLVKPVDTCRGIGIQVLRDFRQILQYSKTQAGNSANQNKLGTRGYRDYIRGPHVTSANNSPASHYSPKLVDDEDPRAVLDHYAIGGSNDHQFTSGRGAGDHHQERIHYFGAAAAGASSYARGTGGATASNGGRIAAVSNYSSHSSTSSSSLIYNHLGVAIAAKDHNTGRGQQDIINHTSAQNGRPGSSTASSSRQQHHNLRNAASESPNVKFRAAASRAVRFSTATTCSTQLYDSGGKSAAIVDNSRSSNSSHHAHNGGGSSQVVVAIPKTKQKSPSKSPGLRIGENQLDELLATPQEFNYATTTGVAGGSASGASSKAKSLSPDHRRNATKLTMTQFLQHMDEREERRIRHKWKSATVSKILQNPFAKKTSPTGMGSWRYLAQKYIERPLVIHHDGFSATWPPSGSSSASAGSTSFSSTSDKQKLKPYKFDIRQWVLVTAFSEPDLRAWFYEDCYLRFATHPYQPEVQQMNPGTTTAGGASVGSVFGSLDLLDDRGAGGGSFKNAGDGGTITKTTSPSISNSSATALKKSSFSSSSSSSPGGGRAGDSTTSRDHSSTTTPDRPNHVHLPSIAATAATTVSPRKGVKYLSGLSDADQFMHLTNNAVVKKTDDIKDFDVDRTMWHSDRFATWLEQQRSNKQIRENENRRRRTVQAGGSSLSPSSTSRSPSMSNNRGSRSPNHSPNNSRNTTSTTHAGGAAATNVNRSSHPHHHTNSPASPSSGANITKPSLDGPFTWQNIKWQMKRLVWISLRAAAKRGCIHERRNSFEIFGYDFMVDARGKVWLIEVNANPDLSYSTSTTRDLVPLMLADAAHVVFGEEKFPCADSDQNSLAKYSLLQHGQHVNTSSGGATSVGVHSSSSSDLFQTAGGLLLPTATSSGTQGGNPVGTAKGHGIAHLPGAARVARSLERSDREEFLECIAGTHRQSKRVGRFSLMLPHEWDAAVPQVMPCYKFPDTTVHVLHKTIN
ncbi:unnamed protein product [Amoebophrya sp. A120]|nr:unnamed protein product [Amoebophrya sp. A120]|eukprot:GSA120T00026066001.1